MTANQINYAKHREEARHNLATEQQGKLSLDIQAQQATAALRQAAVAETRAAEEGRHNRETELTTWWTTRNQIAESQRHNRASETTEMFKASTDEAYKRSTASTNLLNAETQARISAVREREATVAERNAQTNAYQAETARKQLGLGYSQLAESIRAHQASEELQGKSIAETERANRQSEHLKGLSAYETRRHNMIQEDIGAVSAQAAADSAAAKMKSAEAAERTSWVRALEGASGIAADIIKVGGFLG